MEGDAVWLEWDLRMPPDRMDRVVAELVDLGFEGFEERSGGLRAYIPRSACSDQTRRRLSTVLGDLGVEAVLAQSIEERNWNAAWEATVEPVEAGPFVVHPPWKTPPPGPMPICIEPKMSFGTGHHETTRLMLAMLPDLIAGGDRILDAGTGTGVLAIASVLLGAGSVTGFDTDSWSVRNARENAELNGVSDRVRILEGGIDDVPGDPVDVILANINRNVLIDLMPSFAGRLRPGGRIALSGFLDTDRGGMEAVMASHGFRAAGERREGRWIAVWGERA